MTAQNTAKCFAEGTVPKTANIIISMRLRYIEMSVSLKWMALAILFHKIAIEHLLKPMGTGRRGVKFEVNYG